MIGSDTTTIEHFDAEEFVEKLLEEGSTVPCDDTYSSFKRNDIPEFYNAAKFRRGQQFFRKYIFPLFFSKLLGLLSLLALPSVVKILSLTNMSGSTMSAYKRYMATLLHMNIWYESDFQPNSRLWNSINEVKNKHNSASKKAYCAGLNKISQKDMALTQFGFMGFAVVRPELVGIYNVSDEDMSALVHIWRVVGYIMGIEDRYNICRESIHETREICTILIDKWLRPHVEKKDKIFLEMSLYLVDGMWNMNPLLNQKVFLTYLHNMLLSQNNNDNNLRNTFFSLNSVERWKLWFIEIVIMGLQYTIVRWYLNIQHVASLWIMKVYPFLAVYHFGYGNSIVTISPENNKNQ